MAKKRRDKKPTANGNGRGNGHASEFEPQATPGYREMGHDYIRVTVEAGAGIVHLHRIGCGSVSLSGPDEVVTAIEMLQLALLDMRIG